MSRITLEIESGARSGHRVVVEVGQSIRVGRVAPSELLVLDDPLLSGLHFAVECSETGGWIKDLGSRFGTFRRGEQVIDADLVDGDVILAGRTRFVVSLFDDGGDAVPGPIAEAAPTVFLQHAVTPAPRRPARLELRDWFNELSEPLFAILDAAREPTIPDRLAASVEEHQSLFEGDSGKEIAPFGPWLVHLNKDSKLLDELLAEGWGQSWGVYLTCKLAFQEVRKHLRRFLMVKLPDGREVFFRYYDPRVMRTYLQTCTPKEVAEFLGPFDRYLAESADVASVLEFTPAYKDWRKVTVS